MNTYARFLRLYLDEDVPLIRELSAYAVQCPEAFPLRRDNNKGFLGCSALCTLTWSRQSEWPWAIREAGLEPHHLCLDVGSGSSPIKYAIASRCKHLTVVDHQLEVLQRVQRTTEILGFANISSVFHDARLLSFQDNTFDRVFCLSVLEHIPENQEQALRECVRVLKPGGALLLSFDVLLNDSKPGGEFFVDGHKAIELLKVLGIDRTENTPLGMYLEEDKVDMTVILVRYVKPLGGQA